MSTKHFPAQVATHPVKRPHILDVPDEILTLIFKALDSLRLHDEFGFVPCAELLRLQYQNGSNDAIKNTRLTCRRFSEVGLPCLTPLVVVRQVAKSIANLHKIAKHPIIGKSVTAVYIAGPTGDCFVAEIASAIALMSKARRLIVQAGLPRCTAPDIPALLAALGAAGVRLHSLEIYISTMDSLERFRLGQSDHLHIPSAMRNLKRFKFQSRQDRKSTRSRDQLEILAQFLGLLVRAEELETLFLAPYMWALDPALSPPVNVISSRPSWLALSNVILCGVMMNNSDLEHLLNHANPSHGRLELRGIHLLGGSWIPVLDLLRSRPHSAVLTAPSGAECENMTLREYESIFGHYGYYSSEAEETLAERYIRGVLLVNPLLSKPEI